MITLYSMKNVDGDNLYEYNFLGLSTDSKPTFWGGRLIETNSMFLEMDTGDFYFCKTQGSKGSTTKTLFYEKNITEYEQASNYCFASYGGVTLEFPDVLIIEWDGVEYKCNKGGEGTLVTFGAPYDEDNDSFDFSTYPFYVNYVTDENDLGFSFQTNESHIIKMYSLTGDPDTPAVWEKIPSSGGGGGGGAELKPKVTLSVTLVPESEGGNALVPKDALFSYFGIMTIKNGYICEPTESDFISIGKNETATTIITVPLYQFDGDYVCSFALTGIIFNTDPMANIKATNVISAENCELNENTNEFVIPDYTQDASLSISVEFETQK